MKKIFLKLIILVSSLNCIANTDTLLNEIIKANKPCLILDIPSTDCITCRGASFQILANLSATIDDKKIIIISDDKNMKYYFDKNGTVFNQHPIIYDKHLSDALSNGPFSKAILITKTGEILKYPMKEVDLKLIHAFDEAITDKDIIYHKKVYKFSDSVFNHNSIFTYGDNYFGLFNEQFQVGLFSNRSNDKHIQEQPLWNDVTIQKLYNQLTLYGMKNLANKQIRKQSLMMTGTTECVVGNVDAKSESLLFKLYAITITTDNRPVGDTLSDLWPKIFLATNKNKFENILDMTSYSNYTLFDSIHYNKNILQPSGTQYEVNNKHVFLAYSDLEHNKTRKIDGHDIQFLSNVEIVDFTINDKNIAHMQHVYEINEGDNGPGDFFFRVSDKGMPVLVSETNKRINFLEQNHVIYFKDLVHTTGDTVDKIYDIAIHNDILDFAAHTIKNHYLHGMHDLKNKSTTFHQITTDTGYDDMKINNNSLMGFKKDVGNNEVVFDEFSIYPQ